MAFDLVIMCTWLCVCIGKCSISAAINHVQQLSPALKELEQQQQSPRWGIDYDRAAEWRSGYEGVQELLFVAWKRPFSIIKAKAWKNGGTQSMHNYAAVVKFLVQCKLISLITTRSCNTEDKAPAAATRHNHAQTETSPTCPRGWTLRANLPLLPLHPRWPATVGHLISTTFPFASACGMTFPPSDHCATPPPPPPPATQDLPPHGAACCANVDRLRQPFAVVENKN